jgi:TPR repeat protein
MKRLSLILLLALASPAWSRPFEDVAAANAKGDYATALQITIPLARQGVPWAERALGFTYIQGQGVRQNYTEGIIWYRAGRSSPECPCAVRPRLLLQ